MVSEEPSTFGLALRARRGAVMLDNARVLVGGGPPRGCPLITTESPDKIYHWPNINIHIYNNNAHIHANKTVHLVY